jgi:hypothetical protein
MSTQGRNAQPQCRAGWTKHILSGVDVLSQPLGARVLGAVPPDLRRQLDDSIAIGWLPLDVHVGVLTALRTTLGHRPYQQYCVERITSSLHNPALFAKPARAAVRLYGGGGPLEVVKGMPPSMRYIFRNAGDLRIQTSEEGHSLVAIYEGLPSRYAQGDAWSLIWMAAIEAVATYAMEGNVIPLQVSEARHDPSRGYFEWHARTVRSSA